MITPQAGYMVDPTNPNGVIKIPDPAVVAADALASKGGIQLGSSTSNAGKSGYDVFGNPTATPTTTPTTGGAPANPLFDPAKFSGVSANDTALADATMARTTAYSNRKNVLLHVMMPVLSLNEFLFN